MVDSDQEAALEPPRVVGGRYRLVRIIGRGAMGSVYEAHTGDGQRVAVKLIHPQVSANAIHAARFEREARVSQQLDHPGIVRTLGAGTDTDGSLYLVMELLEGETLRDRLDSGRYTSHQALWIVTDVLRALAVAHHAGVVHRDLKPENVFLARHPDGHEVVKLIDFGIARDLESASVTRTETTVGTPSYMAPEQATNPRSVGPATDVWAIGVIMYRLLTGKLPFVGEGPYDIVLRVCATPHVPVLEAEPTADPALAAVAELCLHKDPRTRPGDAEALLALLEPHVSRPRGLSMLQPHADPRRRGEPLPPASVSGDFAPAASAATVSPFAPPAGRADTDVGRSHSGPVPVAGARRRGTALALLAGAACIAALGWFASIKSGTPAVTPLPTTADPAAIAPTETAVAQPVARPVEVPAVAATTEPSPTEQPIERSRPRARPSASPARAANARERAPTTEAAALAEAERTPEPIASEASAPAIVDDDAPPSAPASPTAATDTREPTPPPVASPSPTSEPAASPAGASTSPTPSGSPARKRRPPPFVGF